MARTDPRPSVPLRILGRILRQLPGHALWDKRMIWDNQMIWDKRMCATSASSRDDMLILPAAKAIDSPRQEHRDAHADREADPDRIRPDMRVE